MKVWPHIEDGTLWAIQDGAQTCFWKDGWVPNCRKLLDLCNGEIPHDVEDAAVATYASEHGWCLDRIEQLLPASVFAAFVSVKPPSPGRVDFLVCNFSSDGCFFIKAAYQYLSKSNPPNPLLDFQFSKIWK